MGTGGLCVLEGDLPLDHSVVINVSTHEGAGQEKSRD